jgi:hypothetical protein
LTTDNKTPPKLQHFRQTLFWPLRLRFPETDKAEITEKNNFATIIKKRLTHPWEPVDDLYRRGMDSDKLTRYAEFVYFHPFIRRFLYGDPENGNALHIYQRTDVKTVQITLRKGQEFTCNVDRIHLYLFDLNVTLLVMEISSTDLTELKDVENLLDQFRHAYPPYWDQNGAGHSPQTVTLFDENQQPLANSEYKNQESYLNFVEKHKAIPVAHHWESLLKPFVQYKPDEPSKLISYEQIEDERIPHMAFLAFDKPTLLTKGDFMRLAFADEEGSSNTFPYSTSFSKHFESKYCYDRFWESSEDLKTNPKHNWMTTRYLCCGYAFTMIGEDNPKFFTNEKEGALSHFRHHYFQIGLIAHFHKAALLMLWDELAQAVANSQTQPKKFREDVDKILRKLLQFTHRYWFTEVSNQVQAKELFDMWSNHLGSRELFDRVMKEAQDAHQYLDMREQKEQTDTTTRLTVVATIGLVFVLTLTFFSTHLGQTFEGIWIPIIFITFGIGIWLTLSCSETLSRIFDKIAKKRFWCLWQRLKNK